MPRERGKVKWFNASKGFGFLGRPNKSDVFCHWTAITGMEGYKQLQENQEVEFEVVQGEKGQQAHEVRVVE